MLKSTIKEGKLSSTGNSLVKDALVESVSSIKEELEDHLASINENTNEIQSNFEYMCELNEKIDKISERLDKIQMFLEQNTSQFIEEKPVFEVKKLTKREQEVFLVLYMSEQAITYMDIARKTALTEDLVSTYIANLVQKRVPILKRYIAGKAHLKLDSYFKSVQAKENILGIEQRVISVFS